MALSWIRPSGGVSKDEPAVAPPHRPAHHVQDEMEEDPPDGRETVPDVPVDALGRRPLRLPLSSDTTSTFMSPSRTLAMGRVPSPVPVTHSDADQATVD